MVLSNSGEKLATGKINCFVFYTFRYRNRFWKRSLFDGIDLVTTALNNVYGEGNVRVLEASLRWLSHHSKLSAEHGGRYI